MGVDRQRSLGMLRPSSGFGNDNPLKSPPEAFQQEEFFGQPDIPSDILFFAKRHARQYVDAGKVDASFSEASIRLSSTTSGFLCSGQPEKGLDGMVLVRPVKRASPSISRRPSLSSSTSGKSTLSSSTSDGALLSKSPSKKRCSTGGGGLLPSLQPQKEGTGPHVRDPFECKWMEVDVLKTRKGDQILKEDFCMVFDMYQSMHNDVSLSNSRYKHMCKSEVGRRAMQVCQSVKGRLVRSGLSEPNSKITLEEFLKQVWPQLAGKEENTLLCWAMQRERQLNAIHRLATYKASESVKKKLSNAALPASTCSDFKSFECNLKPPATWYRGYAS